MALAREKYILLTTSKRDGSTVKTPVWVVELDGETLGFWTSTGSGKAKRIKNNGSVTIQACDLRGNLKAGSEPISATARFATDDEYQLIAEKIKAKYGAMTVLTKFLNTVGGVIKRKKIPYGDCGIVVTAAS